MNPTLQDTIVREVTVKADQEKVYAALTDPAKLGQWFPDRVEGKIEPGERPVFDHGEYGRHSVYVVATDPHSYVAYRWIPGAVMTEKPCPSTVRRVAHSLIGHHRGADVA